MAGLSRRRVEARRQQLERNQPMKMPGAPRGSTDIRGAVRNPSPAAPEAHRIMIERVIKESSLERLFDLISDYAQVRAGMHNRRPTISQRRYRELGPAIERVLTIAVKRGL
jgi:hypothetical protein